MKLKKIELRNWGRYPSVTLDVDSPKEKPVVLIRAKNDRGKTTFFYAIKYALYGKKGLASHKNQNNPQDWITHQSAAQGDGEMFVELTIEHGNVEYRIQRKQKFFQTNTGDKINSDGDEELNIFDESGPSSAAGKTKPNKDNWINGHLLPADASQFFFFDGEDIKRYTDEQEDHVEKAILRVLGIKALTNAKDDLFNLQVVFNENYNKKIREKSRDTKTKEVLETKEKKIEEQKTVIEHLQGAQKQSRIVKEGYTKQLLSFEAVKEKIKQREQITDTNENLRTQLNDEKNTLKNLRSISSLLLLDPLLKIIDKTEENPPSKDQWESQTAQHIINKKFTKCVCETKIDSSIKGILKEKVLELKPNPQAALKRFVESTIGRTLPDKKRADLEHAIQDQVRIQAEIDANDTSINNLNKEIGLSTDAANLIPVLRDKEKKAYDEEVQYGRDLERAIDQQAELDKEAGLLRKKLLQAIQSTEVTEAEHQKDFVIKLTDSMKKCIDAYFNERKPELEKLVSDVFLSLTNNKKLYSGVIVKDNFELALKHFNGTTLPAYQYGPSAGAAQIVATSLIAGLNKFSTHKAPVIIDTPLGRLDDVHRTNILKYYNEMSEQGVIILYTPTEINDNDQVILEDYVSHHYQIIELPDQPALSNIQKYEGRN